MRELTFDDFEVIAAECPRGTEADVPEGWELRSVLAASTFAAGYRLYTDGQGRWLRVDSERVS